MGSRKDLSEELKNLWIDKEALDSLKESYVKRPFGFKKALKCAKLSEANRFKFWTSIKKLYPELGENISADLTKWEVFKTDIPLKKED